MEMRARFRCGTTDGRGMIGVGPLSIVLRGILVVIRSFK